MPSSPVAASEISGDGSAADNAAQAGHSRMHVMKRRFMTIDNT
jgi:hypothetical protein